MSRRCDQSEPVDRVANGDWIVRVWLRTWMRLLPLVLVSTRDFGSFLLSLSQRAHLGHRYKRYELASRYAWLYTSVAVAGALSGLLAGVITDYMDGAGGLRGWRCKYFRYPQSP